MDNLDVFELLLANVHDNEIFILVGLCFLVILTLVIASYVIFRGRRLDRQVAELQNAAQALIQVEEARLVKERRGNQP
jgi:hypothetical protein